MVTRATCARRRRLWLTPGWVRWSDTMLSIWSFSVQMASLEDSVTAVVGTIISDNGSLPAHATQGTHSPHLSRHSPRKLLKPCPELLIYIDYYFKRLLSSHFSFKWKRIWESNYQRKGRLLASNEPSRRCCLRLVPRLKST